MQIRTHQTFSGSTVATPGSFVAFVTLFAAAAVVACTRSSEHGTERVAWQERIKVASGPAIRGTWQMNESDYRWVDDPAIDLHDGAEAAVVWVDQARKDIFFQRYARDGKPRLLAPTNVSNDSTTFSWLPRLRFAPNAADQVHVLWQEIVFSGGSHGGEIFFARSSDAGSTFSEPVNLSNSTAGDGKGRLDEKIWDNGSFDLARGPGGELYAVWTEYEGALWLRCSTNAGQSFSKPLRIAGTASTPARAPSLGIGPDHTVHLAWAVGDDPAAKIHVATSIDGGRSFAAPRTVGAKNAHCDAPKIAVDRAGTLHLVYAESPSGRGGRYHVQYTRQKQRAAGFEASRRIQGPRDGEATSESFPAVSVDGRNRVYVLWERSTHLDEGPRGLSFAVSRNAGDHFAASSTMPNIAGPDLGSHGSLQGRLGVKLAVDASGGIAIVNSTFDRGRASHVWLVRGRVTD